MSGLTKIQWTDRTWNPVTGCTKVSPGCKNCYAETVADRFWATQYPANADGDARRFTDVRCHEDRLDEPLRWRKPARVFVNSMSDLFHEDVPRDFIVKVYETIGKCNHIFQILTKRPERMREFSAELFAGYKWTWLNTHLGVSVENQATANERIPLLLQTPAAVRFLSVEPLLERVNLSNWLARRTHYCDHRDYYPQAHRSMIDWVIVGGESGPHARPCNVQWIRDVVEQCKRAAVPCFVKQLGAAPYSTDKIDYISRPLAVNLRDFKGGDISEWPEDLRVRQFPGGAIMIARDLMIGVLIGIALFGEVSTEAGDTATAVFDALNEKWGIKRDELLNAELRDEITMTLAEGLGIATRGGCG